MQSLIALAVCLTLFRAADAGVAWNGKTNDVRTKARGESVLDVFLHFLNRRVQSRDSDPDVCDEDEYYDAAHNASYGQVFCRAFYNYPNFTTTVDYTPVSTYTDITSTETSTASYLTRTTPITTVTTTATVDGMKKREAQITSPLLSPRDVAGEVVVANVVAMFRKRDTQGSTIPSDQDISSSLSSACSCQTYGGSTFTETYTDETSVSTEYAFAREVTTVSSTRTAGTLTSTITVLINSTTLTSTSVAASTSSTTITATNSLSSTPTPTSLPFTCPDDNSTTVSQMIGNERFDYLVLCSYDLTDPNFYGALFYSTFSQCVAACSTADSGFDYPVCQGVSYFNAVNSEGYNCFLKTSANDTAPAVGVDSALLQRILVGITSDEPSGTATESAPFAGETMTMNMGEMSSSFSLMMGNSTSYMPMITPGPPVPVSGLLADSGVTYYSQTVINGTTHSFGTAFSTYVSSNGSWYSEYYTTFTEAWTSSTIGYIVSETSAAVANSSSSSMQEQSGQNGEFSIINSTTITTYNDTGESITQITQNITYASNGTEIASTAVTSSYFSYETSASEGSSGNGTGFGSGGIISASGAGSTTPAFVNVTSSTVIVVSGATAGGSGAFGSEMIGSPTPSTAATTVINTYETQYSSGYYASGVIVSSGAGGAYGASASGALATPTPSTSEITEINSYNTAYGSGYIVYGSGGSTAGGSKVVASGVNASPTPVTSSTIIVVTGGTAYTSGFILSGAVGGTTGGTGAYLSGILPPLASSTPFGWAASSASYSFGAPSDLRTFAPGSSSGPTGTAPSGFVPIIGSVLSATVSTPAFSSTVPFATGLSAYSFTYSELPRGPGFGSSSTIMGTAPPLSVTAQSVSGSLLPATNESSISAPTASRSYSFSAPGAPRSETQSSTTPSGTAPRGYSFSAPGAPRSETGSSTLPLGTVSTPYSFTGSGLPRYGSGSSTLPAGTAPLGTVPSSVASLGTGPPGIVPLPSGYVPATGSGPVYPIGTAYYTGPPLIAPAPTTCANMTTIMGTTTVTTTITSFGCYETCPFPGGYGGPQPYGFPHPTS